MQNILKAIWSVAVVFYLNAAAALFLTPKEVAASTPSPSPLSASVATPSAPAPKRTDAAEPALLSSATLSPATLSPATLSPATLSPATSSPATLSPAVFRLHLSSEPISLKPWEQRGSISYFLLSQIFSSLMLYQDQKLQPDLAEKCEFKSRLQVQCKIKKGATFSDGTPITAEHFILTWKEFLKPENLSPRADLLFSIKNAEKYFLGKIPAQKLGLKADKNILTIDLEKPDPDFLFVLANPLTTPLKSTNFPSIDLSDHLITSGRYKIKSWQSLKKITLIRRDQKKEIEFVFAKEDATALNLYEKKNLDFLRRLPTMAIEKYKAHPDYHEIPQVRLDYIGFGPSLAHHPELRKALVQALNYAELTKLLSSRGQYGCPGLPEAISGKVRCAEFNLLEAQQNLQNARIKNPQLPALSFSFSKLGGEDHKRVAEWMQLQWKKNLGLDVRLEQIENKIFIEKLRTNTPSIFRKGLALEKPTCQAHLSNFLKGATENFLELPNSEWEKLVLKVKDPSTCAKALQYLIDQSYLIFTGPIYFPVLANPQWNGTWKLNELNQLWIE